MVPPRRRRSLKLKNKGVLLAGLFVVAAAFIAAGCGGGSGGGAPCAMAVKIAANESPSNGRCPAIIS